MRWILFLYLVVCTAASAAEYHPPRLPATGGSLADFIPQGWHAIDTAYGELNSQQPGDCILILESDDTVSTSRTSAGDTFQWEGKPRILVVLFGTSNGFSLSCQANDIMLWSNEGGMMGDPYDGITINNRAFDIAFWGGSSEKWNLSYHFTLHSGHWILEQATAGGGNATHSYIYAYNLKTSQLKITIEDDEKPKNNRHTTRKMKHRALPQLEDFQPMSIRIDDEIYL
jgi:hypothetical protein